MKEETLRKRIPFAEWRDSQLSVVRFYGACTINGHLYELDYAHCKTKGEGDEKKYFPDLVLVK